MTIKWPATRAELEAAGYKLRFHAKCNAKACGRMISWYLTPTGKHMPLTGKIGEPGFVLEPHWASCPGAKEFKGKNTKK